MAVNLYTGQWSKQFISRLDLVTFLLNWIIFLTQEAQQAETANIVENGTHTEEANAEENVDDSTVMPFLLLVSRHVLFL